MKRDHGGPQAGQADTWTVFCYHSDVVMPLLGNHLTGWVLYIGQGGMMTWQTFMKGLWQREDDAQEQGRGLTRRRGRKWPEGTEGQNLSRRRGPRARVQGQRSGGLGVREVAYGNDYEDIMGCLLRYSLSLKVLVLGQDGGCGKGEQGKNLRCSCGEC